MGKRKKAGSKRKQLLVFQESPTERGQSFLSPVHCAKNPITAASVPLDCDSNCTWISPHFNGIYPDHGQRRQARKPLKVSLHTTVTRNRLGDSHRRQCFPPLEFINHQPSCSVAGPSQSFDSRDFVRVNEGHSVAGQKGRVTKKTGKKSAASNDIKKRQHKNSNDRANVFGGSKAENCNGGSVGTENDCLDQMTGRSTPVRNNHEWSRINNRTDEASHIADCFLRNSQNTNSRHERKSYNSYILLSPAEVSAVSEPSFAVVKNRSQYLPPKIGLFSSSPSEPISSRIWRKNQTSYDLAVETETDTTHNHSTFDPPGFASNDLHKRFENQRKAEVTNVLRELDRLSPVALRRSRRLQEKKQEALKYLCPMTPPFVNCTITKSHPVVLVADTPETVYNLTYRQKQQMGIYDHQIMHL